MNPHPGRAMPAPPRDAAAEVRRHSVFGPDDRVPVGDATEFPWRAIGKVTVTAEAGVFAGSGFLIGPYHMLTAGHVVQSGSYGGDGWAEAVEVAFGAADGLAPFGRAVATAWRALPEWTVSALPGADWGLVTLDRSIGAHVGQFALGTHPAEDFYVGTFATVAGYPGDLAGGQQLHAAAGTIDSASASQLFYNGTLDTAGGMSGGPLWHSSSATGTRTAIGIHAAGAADPQAPGAVNAATRLTAARLTQIEEWQGQDAILRPPADRPDLTDGGRFDAGAAATLSAASAQAGGALTLTLGPRNIGTAPAEGWQIAVYASANATITELDTLIGAMPGPSLAPFETGAVEVPLTLPANLPTGAYHIGWILDAGDALAEFGEADNTGLLADTLAVAGMPDLVAEALTLSARGWTPGQVVATGWEVRNAGSVAAPALASALHISADAEVTAADPLLLRDDAGSALGPGQAAAEGAPFAFTYAGGLVPGTYWVAAVADPDAALAEGDEANNASPPIRVEIGIAGQILTGTAAANGLAGTPDNDTLRGLGGNDTLTGRAGADLLEGGNDDDAAYGDDGPDTLLGGYGFDTLFGNGGDDLIRGDIGDGTDGQGDVLNGGPGDDTLIGEGGPDTLSGAEGDDRLEGGPGFDQLNGNAGDDTLLGGALRDSLLGGDGDDRIEGEGGNDDIYAGSGNDTVLGGDDPDFADGEAGDDSLSGGSGDDILRGGAGSDTLDGGGGIDRLLGGDGPDLLRGGAGGDRLFGEAGADTVEGGPGDDLIFGNAGDDSLAGGPGADSLVGETGRDTLSGGSGDDMLAGREEADLLLGGAGADLLDGETGDDRAEGGDGDDTLFGRQGADRLEGGAGADFLSGGTEEDTLIGGPGADRLGGDGGVDLFLFRAGDGADHVFDLQPGLETVWIEGGVGSFAGLVFGAGQSGWLTVGYSADPLDVITFQGLFPGDLADDGTIVFV